MGPRIWCSLAVALGAWVAIACGADPGEEDEPGSSSGARMPPPSSPGDAPPPFNAKFGDAGPDGAPLVPPPPGSCSDPNDQGGSEIVAKNLPETSDCDNTYKEAAGVSKSSIDVDYFHVVGNDQGGCWLDTDFELVTAGLELCVFARCKNSTVNAVTGCAQGSPAQSDEGIAGCCATGPGRAVPSWDCDGLPDDDSAEFFVRVRQPTGDVCTPYTIRYRF